ncbi:protein of unknown function DUF1260 [Paenibacillus curdlanolyticus YK9]|uniref:Uncharacterized protein n=1 Tax=Paenibacillus curdlanolyticus YK9 TaxID=717606 RepID=E0IBC6_9BACL|nr:DUF695 domain-containing protein [Paenibacillus curdlanolyticus]EFM10006.1 protein of unknown function DUF1260 [Paenibacillus curdlanolyticus YK9]
MAGEDWGFFERRMNGEHLRLLVNSGYKSEYPIASFDELLSVTVNVYRLSHSGKRRADAVAQLEQWASRLEKTMQQSGEFHYIGRLHTEAKLEFYYYVPDSFEDETIRALLRNEGDVRAQLYRKLDPEWSFYAYMLPDEREQLLIHNAQMVYALAHHGDQINRQRTVYHWLLFRHNDDRTGIKRSLEQLGYHIEDGKKGDPEPDYPYPLVISRQDDVRLDTLNRRVDELYGLLKDLEGKYDGWGSAMQLSLSARIKAYWRRLLTGSASSKRNGMWK